MDASLKNRIEGMILGQFLGDAAALGAHWIYNTTDLAQQFPGGIQGFESPADGHYHAGKLSGDFTHYGDASLVLLEALAEVDQFDARSYGKRFVESMDPKKGYAGYFDAATRGTIENYKNAVAAGDADTYSFQEGADDDQLATISSLAIFVGWFVAKNGLETKTALLEQVKTLTRVRQNNDRAVAYCQAHALILFELLNGRDVHSAFHRAESEMDAVGSFSVELLRKTKEAFDLKHKTVVDATDELGQSCPLICSFPSSVQATAKHNEEFESAILDIIRAGGDSAGRAAIVGSWIGARLGASNLPQQWIAKMSAASRIKELLAALLS